MDFQIGRKLREVIIANTFTKADCSTVSSTPQDDMATTCSDKYFLHHGLLLPKKTHTEESLRFAAEFEFKDDDVLIVTYPKSGK